MIDRKQRIAWIDVLRGIAIIFVVLGHSPFLAHLPVKVFNVIYSFHMPLFFFISGYVFNPDSASGPLLRRRFNSMLKPYFFTTIIVSIVYVLTKEGPSWGWYLFWVLYGNGPNLPKMALHLWFLPCLFLTTVFVWYLTTVIKALKTSILVQITATVILLCLGFLTMHLFWDVRMPLLGTTFQEFLARGLLDNPAYTKPLSLNPDTFILEGLPWCLDLLLVAATFFLAGYVAKQNNCESLIVKGIPALIAILIFSMLHYFYSATIDLNVRRYDNLVVGTVLACSGISICLYLAHAIAARKNWVTRAFQYLGKYALVIFIFHPMIQSRVYFSLSGLRLAGYADFLVAFFSGIGVPLMLNYVFLERFKIFRYWYYTK